MSVILRQRNLAKGRLRYYLEINHNKERLYEFLFVVEPTDDKREKKKLAQMIRDQRAYELQAENTNYIPKHKRNVRLHFYFDNYLDSYNKKDKRVMAGMIGKLKEFIPDSKFLMTQIKADDISRFIHFLNYECGIAGETPKNYYKRFKKVILQANRDGLIKESIYRDVKFSSIQDDSSKTLTKNVLTEDEIRILFDTHCGNDEVKRAFLFGCYTGLGLAEVRVLKWGKIKNERLITNREKTGTEVNLKLSPKALGLLGERGSNNNTIFTLKSNLTGRPLSDNGVNKSLKVWIKRAGIYKNITFYCARHTFATRLLIKGANLKTVSDALAHNSTTNTVKYLNYVNELKDEATQNLE